MEVFAVLTFGLVIYLMCTVPTKKEIRKLANPDAEHRRLQGLREALERQRESACTLQLEEVHYISNAASIQGVVKDVDDDWALIETTDKKGARKLIAMRLNHIKGIVES